MAPLDSLARLPQFIQADAPRSLYNVLSNCLLTERLEAEGLVLQSGSLIVTIEGGALSKYLSAMQMQARQLQAYESP